MSETILIEDEFNCVREIQPEHFDQIVVAQKTPRGIEHNPCRTQRINPSNIMLGGRNPLLKSVQSSIKIA